MKKFKLKKSINEEILQPIVKVTQNENKEDKHYFNQSKYGLINYLKSEAKEGKIKLYESGTIEDEERLKHIIISPCKISRWEHMDENDRLILKESFISKLQFDFKNQNYLLAIEQKTRKNENGEDILMEHYHLVVSNKTPTGKEFKINYKKSLMNNYIENYSLKETREKLGIKTFSEMKEQKIEKLKNHHQEKLKSIIIKDEISTLHQLSKVIFKNKNETMNLSRLQKHHILAQRENIFKEMSSLNSSIKDSNEHLKTINDSVKNLSKIKSVLSNQFLSDLTSYQQRSTNELNDFTLYTNFEHFFFKKLQQQKLKNKVITQEEFITSICRNKSYWKEEEILKRRHIEYEIKNRQIEFQKKIKSIETELLSLFYKKDKQKEIKNFLVSKLNIQKYLSKENNLHLKTTDEIFSKKLNLYNNYILYINENIKYKKQSLNYKNNDFQNNIDL
ncbi:MULTISPECIES: hypothetical protein [Aliarcobacter]|uniref:hypothetical protein n=1 Tax=Aliarcobacter TaxID=2321111 RepID=UPI0021B65B05|nr:MULTISPECIES: hypothetical protein [Aliarcobacter]MCT7497621.1 hypothetical protein [Aliarcobacter cryaerophilus]MDK2080118.1 hypothetical protein [Aliarcobacter butzleri]